MENKRNLFVRIKRWWVETKWCKGVYDFEGRCEICGKSLNISLKAINRFSVVLTVDKCPVHPDDAMILWPADRKDIRRVS